MHFTSMVKSQDVACLRNSHIASTAMCLLTTTQFIEAKRSGHKGFDVYDVREAVKKILAGQFLQLYRFCLIRFSIEHRFKVLKMKRFFYNVTHDNFIVEEDEVDLYLSEPKFLWRHSASNYSIISQMFGSFFVLSSPIFKSSPLTYNRDNSCILPPLRPKFNGFKDEIFKKFKINYNLKYEYYEIDKIKRLLNKNFKFQLTEFEKKEFLYSDDLYLQMLPNDVDHDDFYCALITGQYKQRPLMLYQYLLDKRAEDLQTKNLNKKKMNKQDSCIRNHLKKLKNNTNKSIRIQSKNHFK